MPACSSSSFLRHSRRRPLAASVAALFAVSVSSAWAAPPAVTNCSDSGAGSLRYAVDPVNGAVSGDTIDMSGLTTSAPGCASSTITLTTGAIAVTQQNLTLIGPGQNALLIKQTTPNSRVVVHNVAGSHLYVSNLRVGYASVAAAPLSNIHGGCIASLQGSLTLTNAVVYHCTATTDAAVNSNYNAFGGGVFAATSLTIDHSTLIYNTVSAANVGVRAQGGCAMTGGTFDMRDSIVAYCNATGPTGSYRVRGGAIEAKGNAIITGSVIAKSYSNYIGGVDINSNVPAALTATISNSTVTYNSAHGLIGGVYANSGHINIYNSTIARNTAGRYTYTLNTYTYNAAAGVSIAVADAVLSLQSTIIANNSANGTQEDLSFGASTSLAIFASNNLVRAYKNDVTLPSGQGKGTCPLLGPVRNNGGGTYTFAPQSGSPVIDAGNNTANDPHTGVPAVYDQRGQGPVVPLYQRVSGSAADIGAHEVQKTDIVFNAEFQTGCE